jgi:hypothetical protein
MGVPFPIALRKLAQHPPAKSYAWAANGCASVLGSILSAQIAIGAGSAVRTDGSPVEPEIRTFDIRPLLDPPRPGEDKLDQLLRWLADQGV